MVQGVKLQKEIEAETPDIFDASYHRPIVRTSKCRFLLGTIATMSEACPEAEWKVRLLHRD